MTTDPATPKPKFQMVYANKQNGFDERNLVAETREDAKAECMALVRVLDIDRGYVMEVEEEVIFHSFP